MLGPHTCMSSSETVAFPTRSAVTVAYGSLTLIVFIVVAKAIPRNKLHVT